MIKVFFTFPLLLPFDNQIKIDSSPDHKIAQRLCVIIMLLQKGDFVVTDIPEILENLYRPKILLEAAKLGVSGYNRDSDLPGITPNFKSPGTGSVIKILVQREGQWESARKSGDASYDVSSHIRVMTALLAEARDLYSQAVRSASLSPSS
ncbi:MAG: hypothetical protein GY947_03545 [Rhodobacteraceae bacterium]|nr:hypothetical protein [Paracoccaceae bacterium]